MKFDNIRKRIVEEIDHFKQDNLGNKDGIVFHLDRSLTAKIFQDDDLDNYPSCWGDPLSAEEKCKKEMDLYSWCIKIGMQVPKPEGIFSTEIPLLTGQGESPTLYWILIMERLRGAKHTDDLKPRQRKIAKSQYREQLELASEKGLAICDSSFRFNTLYKPQRKTLYLIDPTRWSRTDKALLDRFRAMLKNGYRCF